MKINKNYNKMENEVKNNRNIIKIFLCIFYKYFQISIFQEINVKLRIFQFHFIHHSNFYKNFKNNQ